jgi:phage-related protein
MSSLPPSLIIEKNRLASPDPFLLLVDIVLTDGTEFHLVNNNENIEFHGTTYIAFPVELDFPDNSLKGELNSAELRVSNITRYFYAYIESLSDAEVTITPVNAKYLNLTREEYSPITLSWDVMKISTNPQWIILTLGMVNFMLKRFPPYIYKPEQCDWEFNSPSVRASGSNKGRECNYQGDKTTCDRTWDDCKKRSNTARFSGHKGLSNYGMRLVR